MDEGKDIFTLASGQAAPQGANHIRIEPLPSGRFRWFGVLVRGEAVTFTDAESDTFEEAKLAGYVWAKDRGARLVYVEDGRPLGTSGTTP